VAALLWDFSQDSFGMVDTSLAKLSLLFPAGSSATTSTRGAWTSTNSSWGR